MAIKKGDFIELDYTATIVDDGTIFDTTNPEDAQSAGMICEHDHEHNHEHGHKHVTKEDFKPIKICVGENQVLPGLDEQLEGLNIGEHDIVLGEDNAFGKKDPKLLKLMPLSAFKKQKINPFVGLTVDMDGTRGIVRNLSGGRVIVDFNHPLSGKSVKYNLKINRKIEDNKEKIESLLEMVKLPQEKITIENGTATIKVPLELPEHLLKDIKKDIERITGLKIVFDIKKPEIKTNTKPETKSNASKNNTEDNTEASTTTQEETKKE